MDSTSVRGSQNRQVLADVFIFRRGTLAASDERRLLAIRSRLSRGVHRKISEVTTGAVLHRHVNYLPASKNRAESRHGCWRCRGAQESCPTPQMYTIYAPAGNGQPSRRVLDRHDGRGREMIAVRISSPENLTNLDGKKKKKQKKTGRGSTNWLTRERSNWMMRKLTNSSPSSRPVYYSTGNHSFPGNRRAHRAEEWHIALGGREPYIVKSATA